MANPKLNRPLGISFGILIVVIGILLGISLLKSVVARSVFQPTPLQPIASQPTPVVSSLNMSHSPDKLLPGEEVKIWVNVAVANPEIPVVYMWSTEGGEIVNGQGTVEITYKAPETPSTYAVSLKMEYRDWYAERSTSVVVVSPTATPSPIPTGTSTPTNTPMPAPIAALTSTPIPDAVVNAEALNLRSGPSVVYDILEALEQGDPLKVTGRNLAGDWLKVIALSGQEGWAARSLLQVNVDVAGLLVVQAPPTPTPTATPTSELLPPPLLLEPGNGTSFIGGPVIFRWQWDRPLEQDEVFSLRVRKEGESELCHHSQMHGLEYLGSLTYCSAGKYYWGVAVARRLCENCPEEEQWEQLSEPSAEQWIYYVPVEEPWMEPWTWPTPNMYEPEPGQGPGPPEP